MAAVALLGLILAGCGSDESGSPSKATVERYRSYLTEHIATLTGWTSKMAAEIEAGALTRAQSRYASSRVPLGQVASFSVSLPALDARIDASTGDVPGNQLRGFHRIEQGLFEDKSTDGLAPVARQLLSDVKALQRKARTAELEPVQIAEDASQVLTELSTSEILGEEEPNAHIDMVDLSAKVEGTEAAFEAVKPQLNDANPELVKEVEASFENAYANISNFGVAAREPDQSRAEAPGISFVLYVERTDAEYAVMNRAITALQALVSQVPGEL